MIPICGLWLWSTNRVSSRDNMFRRIASPSLFDDVAMQRTVEFDPKAPVSSAEATFGVRIPEDLKRAVPSRQIEFLAARFCCREALLALDPEQISGEVGRSPNRAPIWPDGIVGSITHSGGLASVALATVSTCRSIGIDTEIVFSTRVSDEIGDQIAAPDELSLLERDAARTHALAVTLAFSAKESLFKCLYPSVRRFFGFREVSVIAVATRANYVRLRLNTNLSELLPAGLLRDVRFVIEGERVHTGTMLR
jgi:enterobactin synthetase component D